MKSCHLKIWRLKHLKGFDKEDFLQLSGIQHFCFCRRQWALIHIEQQWAENVRTLEGKYLHERAHNSLLSESRGNTLISRGLSVSSSVLGCSGECDIVEFHKDPNGISIFGRDGLYQPIPVEYKRGSPKTTDADCLQLCAQAICLENMLACEISHGFLYYHEIRRRIQVIFEKELREKVYSMFSEMHNYYQKKHTPKVKPSKNCKACSLLNLCLPKLGKNKSAQTYIQTKLSENEEL